MKLYEVAFAKAEDCILVSEDWIPDGGLAKRYSPLFATPGIFTYETSQFQAIEVLPFDETQYRLTWTRLSPLAFNVAQMFQAIANLMNRPCNSLDPTARKTGMSVTSVKPANTYAKFLSARVTVWAESAEIGRKIFGVVPQSSTRHVVYI